MTRIQKIARHVSKLTYTEMKEIAARFSEWTGVDEFGAYTTPTIDSDEMAASLSGWAEQVLSEAEENDL